jgi:indolepyruvate ferredoxin oxidoreductase
MLKAMTVLARLRFLRGSVLDIFGYSAERKADREVLAQYRSMIDTLLNDLTTDRLTLATDIANLPDQLRGYGHIREQSLQEYESHRLQLLDRWHSAHEAGVPESYGQQSAS